MTDAGARYDRMAAGYERWWAPVLAPSAVALLDRLEASVAAGAHELLDVGVGTGNLSIPALRRWTEVRVTGIDASSEMLGAADVPDDGNRFAVVGWKQWSQLLSIQEFASAEYVGSDELPWKGTQAKRWLGTTWNTSPARQ